MNRGLRKFLILLVIFAAALFGFSRLTNHETKDMTTDMAKASMPVVYFQKNGKPVNELHGYADEMDAVSMRDTITPLGSDGVLPVRIESYGEQIKGVSYEVRSLDTTRLVQESEASDLQTENGTVTAQLKIQDLLMEGQEYLFIMKVKTAGDPYYYYTRIVKESSSHIQECLDFVEKFHGITMDKERQSELASYMEPSSDGDNTTLQEVTINSSLNQACWADLEGEEVTEPVASIKELNDVYNVILLDYIFSSVGENGQLEYYNVEEYYRVRVGSEKIYLLSFERTVEEIFRGEGNHIGGDSIHLGIRSGNVDFKANETGNIICFVQQGELWSYNKEENELTQVFSFRSLEGMDIRENYGEHDIRIIRTDEGGSIDFIVYGYMNRGDHEGRVGISVCHYDCVTNTVEEHLFLPTNISYQMMKEEIGRMMYISDGGMFYLTMGDQVHQVNLDTMANQVFISGLLGGNYVSSDNGRYLAWTEDSQAGVMHLTDLETGTSFDVNADSDCVIRPLGFIGTDCIYGQAYESDMIGMDSGKTEYAFSKVMIMDSMDSSHSILKTYENPGTYVTGITILDGSIYLDRAVKSGSIFTETSQDTIMNRDMQEEALVYVSEETSERKQREVILQLSFNVPDSNLKLLVPKQILAEKSTTLELEKTRTANSYYVYAKGKVLLATNDVAEAIRNADENRGVVIGENQTYIWKRGKKQIQQPLTINQPDGNSSSARALSAMLAAAGCGADTDALLDSGKTPYEVLQETVTDRHVYDLTGCSMEQTLYFAGIGMPVYARQPDGNVVLLTGYDDNYVWIYDTAAKKASSRLIRTATEQFAEGGNVYYVIGE